MAGEYVYTFTDPSSTRRPRRKRRILVILCACALVAVVVVVCIFLTVGKEQKHFDTAGSALEYFNTSDCLDITWYHAANSKAKVKAAVEGPYMMVEGDITLRWYGYPNQTNEPIMAHPPDVDSDLTLDEWIDDLIARNDKGLKLDFKADEAVEPSLQLLASKGTEVQQPVWLNADILRGPVPGSRPRDAHKFIETVNSVYPECTLSVGWTTSCCRQNYTQQYMDEMWNIVKDVHQPVTFPARAALLRPSWETFRWLMDQDMERFSITVWTSSGDMNWEGATAWDMLYCRNDLNKTKVYFDLPGEQFETLRNISVTAGTPLNHFPVPDMDGIHITWAHAVNSQAKLEAALNSDLMFLEADVLLRGQGTENQTDIPIMAHPPATESDITLDEWLDKVLNTNKGIKLDFKSIDALEPSLNLLVEKRSQLQQPVFINADVFEGPGGTAIPVNSTHFKTLVNEVFPWATLSVGWTTGWNNAPNDPVYSEANVQEMMSYVKDMQQPVTFPLRAAMVKASWSVLKPLLTMSRGHSFTIWSGSSDIVDPDDLAFIRNDSDVSKIYYDLPKTLMDKFLSKIKH